MAAAGISLKINLKVFITRLYPRALQCETNLYDIMGWEPSRSNDGSLALVSCLSGGYKFSLVLQCVGLVFIVRKKHPKLGCGWTGNVLFTRQMTFLIQALA